MCVFVCVCTSARARTEAYCGRGPITIISCFRQVANVLHVYSARGHNESRREKVMSVSAITEHYLIVFS